MVGDIALIGLTKGFIAICDASDYGAIKDRKWHAAVCRGLVYARHTVRGRKNKSENITTLLHKEICKSVDVVDHINKDTLDCRRGNLRPCTNQQNLQSQKVTSRSKTGVKGVCLRPNGKYQASATASNGSTIYLGTYMDLDAAKSAYDTYAMSEYGEFYKIA